MRKCANMFSVIYCAVMKKSFPIFGDKCKKFEIGNFFIFCRDAIGLLFTLT